MDTPKSGNDFPTRKMGPNDEHLNAASNTERDWCGTHHQAAVEDIKVAVSSNHLQHTHTHSYSSNDLVRTSWVVRWILIGRPPDPPPGCDWLIYLPAVLWRHAPLDSDDIFLREKREHNHHNSDFSKKGERKWLIMINSSSIVQTLRWGEICCKNWSEKSLNDPFRF